MLDYCKFVLHLLLTAYPAKKLVSDGHVMYRHLVSRKSLSRVQESRRRRGLLKIVPGMASIRTK